jgi:hypothetical protein
VVDAIRIMTNEDAAGAWRARRRCAGSRARARALAYSRPSLPSVPVACPRGGGCACRHVDAWVGTLLPVAYTVWVLVLFLRMEISFGTRDESSFPIVYYNTTDHL